MNDRNPEGLPLLPPRDPQTDDLKAIAAARRGRSSVFSGPLIRQASIDAVWKLAPNVVARNPVMFVVYIGAIVSTLLLARQFNGGGRFGFTL